MRKRSINPWTRAALSVLLIAACAGLASLGAWQLRRADEKQQRFEAWNARMRAAPIDIDLVSGATPRERLWWRRATLRGHFLERYVLLDNRVQNGAVGYEVLSPFVSDGGRTVLVDRGWVPLPASREALPDVLVPADPTTLRGFIGPEPTVGIALGTSAGDAEIMDAQTYRVERVDLNALQALLGQSLWPALVYIEADALGALSVAWPPPGDGSPRHRAYAVQWFAMATVLAALGVWHLYLKRRA